jgi:predicted ATP-grasp superfamily ATP-dependent carboligase
MQTIKKVLIVANQLYWQGISRLPSGLSLAGISVTALCYPESYLASSGYLEQIILWKGSHRFIKNTAVLQIIQAIISTQPNLVIPGDEDAVFLLHQALKLCLLLPIFKQVRTVLEKSLCKSEYLDRTISKEGFVAFCKSLGIRVPGNQRIYSESEAVEFTQELGYPVVLKGSIGCGGSMVKICDNDADLKINTATFIAKTALPKLVKTWRNQLKAILPKLAPKIENSISIQQYIKGQISMFAFVAAEGKILSYIPVNKVCSFPGETGPSSVVRTIECQEMYEFAQKIVAATGYNGFGAFDFILEEKTGLPYVIEFNIRPVPICHLGKRLGADMCKALVEYLENGTCENEQVIKSDFIIALFPNEYQRDANSSYLREHYHDVPLDEPKLIKAINRKYYQQFIEVANVESINSVK